MVVPKFHDLVGKDDETNARLKGCGRFLDVSDREFSLEGRPDVVDDGFAGVHRDNTVGTPWILRP